jgi:alpha-tubulin suppressor-like RCC1 family protein
VGALLAGALLVLGGPPAGAQAPEGVGTTLTGVRSVATGNYHSCAVVAGGMARCWGWNEDGQLGRGTTTPTERAVLVRNSSNTGPLRDVVALALGTSHACALLGSGQVRCWGANSEGQVGDGTEQERHLPRPVLAPTGSGRLTNVTQISASEQHTCARLRNGQVRCWGRNESGQLGNGTTNPRVRPAIVRNVAGTAPLGGVTQVDAGTRHTCVRLGSGQARCWGINTDGQLGDDSNDQHLRPAVVVDVDGVGPLTDVRQVSAGETHSCAATLNNRARCWGSNNELRLGNGSAFDSLRPGVVVASSGGSQLTQVRSVVAAGRSSCALLTTGQVRCWGDHDMGQIGDGPPDSANHAEPVAVRNASDTANLSGVTRLAGMSFTFCVRIGAQARCWGYGDLGGLGNGADDNSGLPVTVVT